MVENLGIGKLYENKVGALFVQCFFFLSVYLSWNIAGVQFSCLFTFLADACENPTRLGKK